MLLLGYMTVTLAVVELGACGFAEQLREFAIDDTVVLTQGSCKYLGFTANWVVHAQAVSCELRVGGRARGGHRRLRGRQRRGKGQLPRFV